MKVYPSLRYHPNHEPKLVANEQEDAALSGWFHSPAEFGVETCPGRVPDPVIAAKREQQQAEANKKVSRKAKA